MCVCVRESRKSTCRKPTDTVNVAIRPRGGMREGGREGGVEWGDERGKREDVGDREGGGDNKQYRVPLGREAEVCVCVCVCVREAEGQ